MCLFFCEQVPKHSTGGLSIFSLAQLWPAQWGAPILVRHDALNRRAHAVFSQPCSNGFTCVNKRRRTGQSRSLFWSDVWFFIRGLCSFLRFFMCRMRWDSLPVIHSPLLDLSLFFPPVHNRWKWCCQLLSHVSKKLIMTGSSLLYQHHTLFVNLLYSLCVTRVRDREAGQPHSAVVCMLLPYNSLDQ